MVACLASHLYGEAGVWMPVIRFTLDFESEQGTFAVTPDPNDCACLKMPAGGYTCVTKSF